MVVGFDGSPPSERALERAGTLAGAHGTVVVVTASPSRLPPGVTSEPILDAPPPEERNAMLQRSRAMLQRSRAMLQRSRALLQEHGTQATLVATDSDPVEALIQAARDQRAELIVVGHTGSGYVTRALLGSTAENVVRHAPCDVLVVR
jgi:nucleotide-binding universal stress UspA family protein